jgi:hypothetical protein
MSNCSAKGLRFSNIESGTLNLSSLARALPPNCKYEQDENKLRYRKAVKMLFDASLDKSKVPSCGDSSPLGYTNTVLRETLLEHRVRCHETQIRFDTFIECNIC